MLRLTSPDDLLVSDTTLFMFTCGCRDPEMRIKEVALIRYTSARPEDEEMPGMLCTAAPPGLQSSSAWHQAGGWRSKAACMLPALLTISLKVTSACKCCHTMQQSSTPCAIVVSDFEASGLAQSNVNLTSK